LIDFVYRVEQKGTENKTLQQNVLLQTDKVTALEERFVSNTTIIIIHDFL